MFEFKNVSLKSKKLNRELELEAYDEITDDGGNIIILSTKSLQKVFESIKEERGITDSTKFDIYFNDRGKFMYASAEWTLKDKFGYNSTFIGEATELSLDSLIAKKYPKTTAFNRAQAAGIIAYLMLPGKVYSEAQITPSIKENEDENKEKNDEISTSIKTTISKKEKDKSIAGIITAVPTLSDDMTIKTDLEDEKSIIRNTEVISNHTENSEEEKEESELPFNNEESTDLKTETKTEKVKVTDESVKSTKILTDQDKEKTDSNEINDSTLFGITPIYGNKTIGEIIQMYNSKDAKVIGLIKMLITGKVKPTDAQSAKVIAYMKKKIS